MPLTLFAQHAKVVHTLLPTYSIGDNRNDRIAAVLAMRRMLDMSKVALQKLIDKINERVNELANEATDP